MSNYGYQQGPPYGGGGGGAPQDPYGYYGNQYPQQQQQPQPQQYHQGPPYHSPPPPQQYHQSPPPLPHPSQQPNISAPQPQHIHPQAPDQMVQSLSRLDIASNTAQTSHSSPSSAYTPHPGTDYSPAHGYNDSPGGHPQPLNVQQRPPQLSQPPQQPQTYPHPSMPPQPAPQRQFDTFFPGLPKLPFRSTNIPESDDDRGARLDRDRLAVLGSSNFEDQLGWAQDALNWVDAAAEQNARLTILGQGRRDTPAIETQMRTDALNVTTHMANQNHPRALFMKGMWLEFGKFDYPEDKREAFECFSRAARGGYARAEYRIGMQFEATGSPSQALSHYHAGEKVGDAASCYRMGMIYALGQMGQPQDFNRAVSLIRHAAESSDDNAPQGAYVYGMLLANDLPQIKMPEQFLPRDTEAGKRYIEKSAWLGFSKAQLKMASAYEVASLNCEVNPALSMHYNALAARQGEPEADMALSKWFVVGSENIFPKDERLAYLYAERAAGCGLPIAYFAMGYFNEVGAGTNPNIEQAKTWYQKAAGEGNNEARDALQRLSNNHQLSMRDHENVTIGRIKSTHGSQRGNRPQRFQQRPVNAMPTVPDEAGPPGGAYPQVANYVRPVGATPPPRAGLPPTTTPPRASSAAPYPHEDGPRPIPSSAPYPGADPRPSMPGYPPQGPPTSRPYSNGPPGSTLPRKTPPPNQSLYTGPVPSAHPPPIRTQPTANRIPSGPAPQLQAQYPPGPGPQPGGYAPMRPPKEPVPPQPQPHYSQPPYQQQPPPQQQAHAPGPRSHPGSRVSSTSLAPSAHSVGPSSRPTSASGPPGAGSGPRYPSSGTPRPTSTNPGTPRPAAQTPQMPAQSHMSASAPSSRPSAPPLPAAGTGPKTFEQMGVPAAKNESECVVM